MAAASGPVVELPPGVSAATLFEQCVGPRLPGVLRGVDPSAVDDADAVLTAMVAGDGEAEVLVERRGDDGTFGRGMAELMTFARFLERLGSGDTTLYLTVQPPKALPQCGLPQLVCPPVTSAIKRGLLPLQPALLPTLAVSTVNIWIGGGAAGRPTSSGLHHDYHDNFYMLLRGKKTFRLFPPADTPNLYPNGKLLKIHGNGRINYDGAETASDGRVLPHHRNPANDQVNNSPAYDPEEAASRFSALQPDAMTAFVEALVARGEASVSPAGEIELDFCALSEAALHELGINTIARNSEGVDHSLRHNHSQLPAELVRDGPTASSAFPLWQKATQSVVELEAPASLYMPAGWWHEVSSEGGASGEDGVVDHGINTLAINWWFHPPDSGAFDAPYSSTFFPEAFRTAAAEGGWLSGSPDTHEVDK